MSNLLVNTRDQEFVLFEQLQIDKLFETEAFKDFTKDDLLMVLREAEKLAVNIIAPTLAEGDKEGCTFKDGKVSVPKCSMRYGRSTMKAVGLLPGNLRKSADRVCRARSTLP